MKKDKKITVKIPKRWRGDDERFISCNGRRVMVKTGVDVELDPALAEVDFNSARQREEAEERIKELVSVS